MRALLSSASQDWQTPPYFLDLVRQVGPIAFDPATTPDNPTGAARYCAGIGGLLPGWDRPRGGLAFVNPPYGRHLSGPVDPEQNRGWARRIAQDLGEWIALVPTRTDARWWHDLHSACSWGVFWRSPEYGSRIQFVDPDTGRPRGGSTLASSVCYHGARAEAFLRVFGPHGRPFPGERTLVEVLSGAPRL